ncbi:MAG: glutaredoxin family protein [Candidatus Tectomicrobia bacterium]|uniref:Glutaredoxin family protein n=1 Tax=Tectimicrobiota bacterium TaxID=2528274 RepID=A0A932ZTY6_UNCTE|nr:glutaredoxin family protein [Candidatus Tectomicrobia bacterium]MBI4252072.1 glutaredoxin family protein [Candidatus Tectomicrobia bacterium]
MPPSLVLYTRRECHLCEEAKGQLRALFPGLPAEEVDVDSDPALAARHGEEVPVAFLGGVKVFKHRLDPARLRRLLG